MPFSHSAKDHALERVDEAAGMAIGVKPSLPSVADKQLLMANYMQSVANERCKIAFSALFALFAPKVKRYILSMGADDASADELTQETFLAVWMKAVSYDPKKAAVSTWVYRVARNKFIDAYRKNRRVQLNSILHREEIGTCEGSISAIERSLEFSQVLEAIHTLPAAQRLVLQKMYMEGHSQDTIAIDLGIPVGTVKSRVRLAYKKIRDQIKVD